MTAMIEVPCPRCGFEAPFSVEGLPDESFKLNSVPNEVLEAFRDNDYTAICKCCKATFVLEMYSALNNGGYRDYVPVPRIVSVPEFPHPRKARKNSKRSS